MNPIKIEVCCGTTCYMLGGAKLLNLESQIPEAWKPYIDLCAIPCRQYCESNSSLGSAPFIIIDGQVYGNATEELISEIVSEKLRQGGITLEGGVE